MEAMGKPAGKKQSPAFLPVLARSSTVSALLKGAVAAVHAYGLAMYEGRRVGTYVQYRVGYILRHRHAANRVHLDLHLLHFLRHVLLGHTLGHGELGGVLLLLRDDSGRAYAVDVDAVAADLLGDGFGEADDSTFARGV